MDIYFFQVFVTSMLVAAAGGMLGSFALLRRMALVGDALSHVALPGIALALLFHVNLFLGALVFLALGTFIIWAVEHKTKLPVDTLVGVMFALALAIGALLTPQEDIVDALFGNVSTMTNLDFLLAATFSLAIIAFLFLYARKLTLALISRDLAQSVGFKPHTLELIFLLIFALMVAVGIQFAGALLMGSLIIIPAATARNVARSMSHYMWFSVAVGVFGALLAVTLSYVYGFSLGPTFVLFASALFFISALSKK